MTSAKPHSRRQSLKAALFAIVAAGLTASALPALAAPSANIVGTAAGSADHTTLVAAVKAGGLVETLSGKGPFTILAPTDEAFAKLPAGTLEMLLKPENKKQLVDILSYHVVPGVAAYSDSVAKMTEVPTVLGSPVAVKVVDGKVMLNGANVVAADVEASTGVIHVIDAVLLPAQKAAKP